MLDRYLKNLVSATETETLVEIKGINKELQYCLEPYMSFKVMMTVCDKISKLIPLEKSVDETKRVREYKREFFVFSKNELEFLIREVEENVKRSNGTGG